MEPWVSIAHTDITHYVVILKGLSIIRYSLTVYCIHKCTDGLLKREPLGWQRKVLFCKYQTADFNASLCKKESTSTVLAVMCVRLTDDKADPRCVAIEEPFLHHLQSICHVHAQQCYGDPWKVHLNVPHPQRGLRAFQHLLKVHTWKAHKCTDTVRALLNTEKSWSDYVI